MSMSGSRGKNYRIRVKKRYYGNMFYNQCRLLLTFNPSREYSGKKDKERIRTLVNLIKDYLKSEGYEFKIQGERKRCLSRAE